MSEELNKYIHEEIMGECWHEWEMFDWHGNRKREECSKCRSARRSELPDYCTDLNAIALAETKVIEVWGGMAYAKTLYNIAGCKLDLRKPWVDLAQLATSDALTRAKAIRSCWESDK